MDKKTNKTDHVLNLLSGNKKKEQSTTKEKTPAEKLKENKAKEKKAEEVASLIHDQLALELEKEEQALNDKRKDNSVEEKQPSMEEQKLEEEQQQESNIEQSLVGETVSNVDEQTEHIQEQPIEEIEEENVKIVEEQDYTFVNVMEYVVEQKALSYMKQFGTCQCSRCVADVKAYTLTNLPAKYIVIQPDSVLPLLNFYSNKYSSQVLVSLTQACILVKEKPHHSS